MGLDYKKAGVDLEAGYRAVELMTDYAVISLPSDSVWVDMTIKVMQNGKVIDVECQMDTQAIREAFREADENYIADDAVYVLTEKGREIADQMKNDPNFDWDAYFGPITPIKS